MMTLAAELVVAVAALIAPQSGSEPAGHAGHSGDDGAARAAPPRGPLRLQPWDPEVVHLFETIPVQDQGRIKPLLTFADFKLLQLYGRRSIRYRTDGHGVPVSGSFDDRPELQTVELSSVEWLLDCFFFPDQARQVPCFLLTTWALADAIHVPYAKEGDGRHSKRDRWSYDELTAGRLELDELVRALHDDPLKREAKHRSLFEEQLWELQEKVFEFEKLTHLFDSLRHDYAVGEAAPLAAAFGGAKSVGLTAILEKLPQLAAALKDTAAADPVATDATNTLLSMADQMSGYSFGLSFLPPSQSAKDAPEWLTITEVFRLRTSSKPELIADQLAPIGALESICRAMPDVAAAAGPARRLNDSLTRLAQARGEGMKSESEVAFYKADLFYKALVGYVLCFVAVAIGWLLRSKSLLNRAMPYLVTLPLAAHSAAIVWRCILQSRPPVTNLYETIPFIGAGGVIALLVIEFISRRRIAVAIATVMGAATLFLASSYEAKEAFAHGSDTMHQLEAVLDTNYWLATHVTTINLGYAAALTAGLIAHVYVLGRLFGAKKKEPDFYPAVARMTYGAICFGLLLSVVGTILGGVWANDSWGRFWGWDPKENGALMICLCELAILHARMGGYVRELGLCNAAVLGNAVVIFSWWHVNELGEGLHSYGKTEGTLFWIWLCYTIEFLVFLAGMYLWLDDRARRKASAAAVRTSIIERAAH